MAAFDFVLNGQRVTIADPPVHTTLLDFIRARGLTGAKEGCAEGECGACTVVMVDEGPCYRAVNSCLMWLPMAANREIYTVEALAADGHLTEVQGALLAGGSQCGYCTPGFVMSLFAEQYRPGRTGPCDPHAMGGNLCRCTGYRPIRDAALALGPAPDDGFRRRLEQPVPALHAVDYRGYRRPTTLAHCWGHGGATFVAGGTDLGVEVNLKGARWPALVDLTGVAELRTFADTADEVRIGASLPLTRLAEQWPVARPWLDLFASPTIRNRATLGGNLATASPIGDGAPFLLSLDAVLHLQSGTRARTLPLSAFFRGYRRTALTPGELIVAITVPRPLPAVHRFYKVAKRGLDDISTVAAAFALDRDADGLVTRARLAFGGVAATPVRASDAEQALVGRPWDRAAVARAQAVLAQTLTPLSDHRGSAAYRLAVAQSLVEKFWYRGRVPMSVGQAVTHESARGHVTGEALYTDDLVGRFPRALHAWPVCAPHAHARLVSIDPGGATVIEAPDFAGEVLFHSQPVLWVLGETLAEAQARAAAVRVEYAPLPAILTIEDAIAAGSFLVGPRHMGRGDLAEIDRSRLRFSGELRLGGQEHFYLETQCALAWLDEAGGVSVHCSTQHPSETQEVVAHALGLPRHRVTVECLRMGGAFGGKEVQANVFAAVAALGAARTGRPVRVRLTRALDMALTGKRHPFLFRYRAGFDTDGRLRGLDATLYSDGGWSLDLSEPILWRALFHADNAYHLPNVRLTGYACRTHKTSQTAFRGFGGPQGMVLIEDILDHAARRLSLPPDVVRARNFYREGDTTHYGQVVKDASRIAAIWDELKQSSEFDARRRGIDAFNAGSPHRKRGLAITPVKFGISFTATFFNQAGALVLVYRDGSVQVNHGGTEMGQGLQTKIRQIAATGLGVPLESVRVMPARTDKIPNTSATAASAGTDLNGAAVLAACRTLRERLAPVAADLGDVPFAALCEAAYLRRIPLFAQGFYATPDIAFDQQTSTGKPFHYYAYGAAVSEVEVDGFTGQYRLLRTDILHDVGDSISPLIDRGQVEGGFAQGAGWLTLEELLWDGTGKLATAGASTYKLPSWTELPEIFQVRFLDRATEPDVVYGSKAVGEPPLMLAISVREALRDAVAVFGDGGPVPLDSPATPERMFFAIARARFLARVGWVFEHSPWVAARAWSRAPFDSVEALHAALVAEVYAASRDEQLALLRAHPDLGSRARMSEASTDEQAGAGLDRLTPAQFDTLTRLNAAYHDTHGFPFLFAVKGATPHDILTALETRLGNPADEELAEALRQVSRIAWFRLTDSRSQSTPMPHVARPVPSALV